MERQIWASRAWLGGVLGDVVHLSPTVPAEERQGHSCIESCKDRLSAPLCIR
jgi:hypothetical protein